ncbi:MAG: glucose-1-phosphate adenylyltransferase subunit GlgD [Clostridia bacterium]|nr:glucose-1-phosphate adenylyltransferase subunit GlgD [Clostridia bacterium]
MKSTAGIIFSNLNDNTLSRLTADRTVAAIPFGCRYRLVDFALSNMINAGITAISIIANYNYRSLTEHIGSGKDWDLARREGGISFVSPYKTARTPNAAMYSHHLEALKNMQELIREIKQEYVVLSDTDNLCNIPLTEVLEQHEATGASVTMVCAECTPDFTSKTPGMMVQSDETGKITRIIKSDKYVDGYIRFANIYVMRTDYLVNLIDEAFAQNHNSLSEDIMMREPEKQNFYVYCHKGTVAPVSSFQDYYKHSIALATDPAFRRELFGEKERPIYTNVHNSPPVRYLDGATVKNSMIADGCVIEGTVENSILFRGVKIGKGAVVKNSVLFAGTEIGDGSTIQCVVADKYVSVSAHSQLSGAPTLPFFICKGRKV